MFKVSNKIIVFVRGQLPFFSDVHDLLLCQTQAHVLRLQISVDHLANPVLVIETHQELLRKDPDQGERHALIVVALNHFQQVDSQDFKHHNEVLPMGSIMKQAIQKLYGVGVLPSDMLEFLGLFGIVLLQ